MAVDVSERDYRAVIRLRTRKAREATNRTQADMANLLHTGFETYKKWENRSVIPHHKIALFCNAAQIDANDLMGQPTKAEMEEIRQPVQKGKPVKIA